MTTTLSGGGDNFKLSRAGLLEVDEGLAPSISCEEQFSAGDLTATLVGGGDKS